MKYNIGFTLGDPGGDGHACTTDYHIVANHSADEISKAYKETTKLLGFDFIKEVGVDFQSDYWIPEKFTKELLKLGIIDEKYVRESDAEWGAPAGCGKSTLVNVIRDYQCDNSKDDPNAVYQTKLGYCDIRGFKNKVEISTDFTRFYFISAEFDDPTSLNNSASAEALLENGGFQTKRMSTGQRGLAMLSKWLEENKEHWDEKTLLVFDEVDKGFDLSRQVGMSNMYRNLHKKFNVSILAVTHTLFPILAREEMFYFEFRKMVSSKFYCWMKTGYNITAEKLEENERKED